MPSRLSDFKSFFLETLVYHTTVDVNTLKTKINKPKTMIQMDPNGEYQHSFIFF